MHRQSCRDPECNGCALDAGEMRRFRAWSLKDTLLSDRDELLLRELAEFLRDPVGVGVDLRRLSRAGIALERIIERESLRKFDPDAAPIWDQASLNRQATLATEDAAIGRYGATPELAEQMRRRAEHGPSEREKAQARLDLQRANELTADVCPICGLPFDRTGKTRHIPANLLAELAKHGDFRINTRCPRFIGDDELFNCHGEALAAIAAVAAVPVQLDPHHSMGVEVAEQIAANDGDKTKT